MRFGLIVFVLICSIVGGFNVGFCPNECNGNGLCNLELQCECYDGFTDAADCSRSNLIVSYQTNLLSEEYSNF